MDFRVADTQEAEWKNKEKSWESLTTTYRIFLAHILEIWPYLIYIHNITTVKLEFFTQKMYAGIRENLNFSLTFIQSE